MDTDSLPIMVGKLKLAKYGFTLGGRVMTPTAREIAGWAASREAQSLIPMLVRRLIHGSVSNIRTIDFPAGDSVQTGGIDGSLEVDDENPWVPRGASVWEFGCNKNVKPKANADYEKRTKQLDAADRRAKTFVFVTPRRWTRKNSWAKNKKAWKAVRCLDADDLEQWLEIVPAAATWLSEQIGLTSAGFRTAQRYWKYWANACNPEITRELTTAGRTAEIEQLISKLSSPPGTPITISADSREEALAFACAALPDSIADRLLIASSSSPIERLQSASKFILAVETEALEKAIGVLSGTHILIPRARGETSRDAEIVLGSIRPEDFEKALKNLGLSEHDREAATRESGRSLPILRRRWAKAPALRQPEWAGDTALARKLVPFALCGSWSANRDGDLSALALMADQNKEGIEKDLSDLMSLDDSPVEVIGSVHRTVSAIDALYAVGKRITQSDLDRFFLVVESTLSVRDPALDLPPEERWMANVFGKGHPFSGHLTRSLGDTLILLAIHGNAICGERIGYDLSARVHSLVTKLLSDLSGEQWLSIRGALPLLAEAAPDAYLHCIEKDLAKPTPGISDLMPVIEGGVTGSCQRVDLLWALEILAWSPVTFSRVADILACLSQFPINDNWANKPTSSLMSLFRSWLPQTASPIERRMAALRYLWNKYPKVAFDLCIKLVDDRGIASPNARPRWRSDAAGAGHGATHDERLQMVFCAADLLTSLTPSDVGQLAHLVAHLAAFDPPRRQQIWDLIDAWLTTDPSDEDKAVLREAIRRHALSKRGSKTRTIDKKRAQLIYDNLIPQGLFERYRWLFNDSWLEWSSEELEGALDHDARGRRVVEMRTSALRHICESLGSEAIVDFAMNMRAPGVVGFTLASCKPEELDISELTITALAQSKEDNAISFLRGLWSAVDADELLAGLEKLFSAFERGEITHRTFLRALTSAPSTRSVWEFLTYLSSDVANAYWKTAPIGWERWSSYELEFLVQRLLSAKRPRAALHAAHLDLRELSSHSILSILEGISTMHEETIALPESYYFEEAFNQLDKDPNVDRSRVAQLEFGLAQVLARSERGPAALHEQLSRDPKLFVQLLAYLYKRRDSGEDPAEWRIENPTAAQNVAHLSWEVLHNWRRLPGQKSGGTVDSFDLMTWFQEARRLCDQHGRAETGDTVMGEMLAHAPSDPDGAWPCVAVRDILEIANTEALANGFRVGTANTRGITSRDPYEGGKQERELAERYNNHASTVEARWPRTASILRGIAEQYRREAAQQDKDARLNEIRDL